MTIKNIESIGTQNIYVDKRGNIHMYPYAKKAEEKEVEEFGLIDMGWHEGLSLIRLIKNCPEDRFVAKHLTTYPEKPE